MRNCQFYVIFGNSSYNPNDNYNVYINVSDNEISDYKLLVKKLTDLYNVKYQEKIPVNSKIIFKIFDEKYRNIALKIMELTGIVGEVEYNYKENNSINDEIPFKQNINKPSNESSNSNYSYKPNNVVRPDTMIFYKDDFYSSDGGSAPSKVDSNVKALKKTPKNRAGIVSLPVLIFIISTLLLIASFVMLFILD